MQRRSRGTRSRNLKGILRGLWKVNSLSISKKGMVIVIIIKLFQVRKVMSFNWIITMASSLMWLDILQVLTRE